ncbi:hypothetical protein SLS53_004239 [Cytospora paraplurivora]|uniref:Uncharacterized protein n=1 Tax=Cytospora paraplurivora TaxID=2898453 RepID=A0AAN9U7T3_9PEZI
MLAVVGFICIQIWKQDKGTIPPRIVRQRSVAFSTCYVFLAGGAVNIYEYYLPVWFQAIQGVSALESGIHILVLTLGTVLFSFAAGFGVSRTGYYTPFMIIGAACLVAGSALTTTFRTTSPTGQWIGYQIPLAAGAGLGIQQAHTAAQTVLAAEDVPTGAVVLIFAQIIGGTIWLSVAQNVLTSQLLQGLVGLVPDLDASAILAMGATGLRAAVGKEYLAAVEKAYNMALTKVFFCSVALAAGAFVASLGMEWRSIKKRVGLERAVTEVADAR